MVIKHHDQSQVREESTSPYSLESIMQGNQGKNLEEGTNEEAVKEGNFSDYSFWPAFLYTTEPPA